MWRRSDSLETQSWTRESASEREGRSAILVLERCGDRAIDGHSGVISRHQTLSQGAAAEEVDALRTEARRGWHALQFSRSFQDRLPGIGVVDEAAAWRLGAVGPGARAAGVADDLRTSSRRLAYDGFEPVMPERAAGDVQARVEQRALELEQTFDLLDMLLDREIAPATAEPGAAERPIGIGRVESPRGATSCVVECSDDRIERLRLRTGSYANWPVVAFAAADNLLPDFPLINKSFELCYACADR